MVRCVYEQRCIVDKNIITNTYISNEEPFDSEFEGRNLFRVYSGARRVITSDKTVMNTEGKKQIYHLRHRIWLVQMRCTV
jgi:hypothetical protein